MTSVHDNPLLDVKHPIAFDRFRADQVVPAIRQLLGEARERLDAIAQAPPSWDSTLGALDTMTARLDDAMGVVSHLESVAMTPELRAAYNEIQPEVSAFYSGIVLSEPLWNALKAYAATDEARELTGARKRFLDKTMADFRRHGADLDAAGKKAIAAVDVELGQLTLNFSQNVLDATGAFELLVDDEARLAGLPEGARAAARQSAEHAGKTGWRFTLQAPSYIAAVTYLDDARLREQLYRAFNGRAASGAHDNRPIVRRILELRQQKARLLGFKDFADLVLADRMAQGGEQARRFVATLRDRTQAAFEAEKADLMTFRRELEGPDAPALAPWDVAYYAEKQRHARYDLDEEELRPYFAADRVIDGLFAVAHRLYGISVETWSDAPVWHPSVRAFTMRDGVGGAELARFYVDIYPREDKRDGAWMHGLIQGHGADPRGVAVFAANLTPPVGDQPALLTHREVETLF
ncbi:MAG: M3 family peptidase, partial [Myxococcales bacterium]